MDLSIKDLADVEILITLLHFHESQKPEIETPVICKIALEKHNFLSRGKVVFRIRIVD
jgi:hypothetical protein